MESNKILTADILDILFEGKNKEYGAYVLRKTYNGRLVKAMTMTGAVIFLLIGGWFLSGLRGAPKKIALAGPDLELASIEKEKPPAPTPPPPKRELPQVKTLPFTPPKLVEEDVKPDERPPAVDEMEIAKIGTIKVDGPDDPGMQPSKSDAVARGIVETPKKKDADDEQPMWVEIESTYPGGLPAWQRFLKKNIRCPEEAIDKGIVGTMLVQFVVDREGNVSDVQIISGPEGGGLREEVLRVFRKSGKWTPGIMNGKPVKSYKRQPIVFRAPEE
jgi:protein TonB